MTKTKKPPEVEEVLCPEPSKQVDIRIVSEELVTALTTYLSTKPISEASNLYHALVNSPKTKALIEENGSRITIVG
jgi:hypothetical protein